MMMLLKNNNRLLILLHCYVCLFVCGVFTLQRMEQTKEYYSSIPPVKFEKADAEPSDVIYKLFTNSNGNDGKNYTVLNTDDVGQSGLDKTIPTVLIIHGWTTDDTSPWYDPLRNAYLSIGTYNIFYIDWSIPGNKSYSVSSANIKPVGKYIAEFLVATGINPKKIHIVGHSLGSQLSGFIGKNIKELTGEKLGRITALDPAGPSFEHPLMNVANRLNASDAIFVDVIHTDVQYYGFSKPLGHVDYYPNSGGLQPGCPADRKEDDNCSHARSTLYFIESVTQKVYGKESTFDNKDGNVTILLKMRGEEIIFGQHVNQSARGVYYFTTNPSPPYLCCL